MKKQRIYILLLAVLLAGCGSKNGTGDGGTEQGEIKAGEGYLVEEPSWESVEPEAGEDAQEKDGISKDGEADRSENDGSEDGGAEGEEEKSSLSKETVSLFGNPETMNHDVNGRELPVYCVDTEEKKVALSFDAGWGNEDTEKLLEILKNHDLQVTFFMTGDWVSNYPDDVKAILDAGHDLGNHSENHKNMSQISDEEKKEELMKVHQKVKELTDYEMFLFRPPYGDYDNAVIDVAKDCRYYTIQWDVDSLDWQNKGVDSVINTVINHKNLGNGSIILCHNGAEYTAQALDTLITKLEEAGYEIVPVSELIYKEDFHMNFEGRQIRN